ncbi:bactofilin family protein [Fluviispira vulneris]|uniref:bactofilin family protein n=1 Tax=Fluviispira vulneris TaxID=2763012 RepID=UPI001645587E|nr:polymer-forming cytoskeletal protein [Fluviispira vulneris]
MFSKVKDAKVLSSVQGIENSSKKYKGVPFSLLGSQTFFQGKVILKGEARLAGHVEGTIISEDILILEESALIKGEIHGVIVEISGIFEGNLYAADTLRLTSSARVEGEISSYKLIVEEGAKLRGKLSCLEAPRHSVDEIVLSVVS